jgi:hypothetical protein
MSSSWSLVPGDVVESVALLLEEGSDLGTMRLVCRRWRQEIDDHLLTLRLRGLSSQNLIQFEIAYASRLHPALIALEVHILNERLPASLLAPGKVRETYSGLRVEGGR